MKVLKVTQFFNLDQVKISSDIYKLCRIIGNEGCCVVDKGLLLRFEANGEMDGNPEDWEIDIQAKTVTKKK